MIFITYVGLILTLWVANTRRLFRVYNSKKQDINKNQDDDNNINININNNSRHNEATTTTTALLSPDHHDHHHPHHHHHPVKQRPRQKYKQQQQQKHPIVDILSIGSVTQQELQTAQRETLGSHVAIRHFYAATEADDSEPHCHTDLTTEMVLNVSRYCKRPTHRNMTLMMNTTTNTTTTNTTTTNWMNTTTMNMTKTKQQVLDEKHAMFAVLRTYFFRAEKLAAKPHPVGWLCAQKRPLTAFGNLIAKYQYHIPDKLPDYLWVLDDDTWINWNAVLPFITKQYPPNQARVVAGCLMMTQKEISNFTAPFGGFGILWTRRALQNWIQPLYCDRPPTVAAVEFLLAMTVKTTTTTAAASLSLNMQQHAHLWTLAKQASNHNNATAFEVLACWRLEQDGIGERALFRNGMNVAELMVAYATHTQFTQVDKWEAQDSVGFCMHSDWAWAYFANYYHIGQPFLDHHHKKKKKKKNGHRVRRSGRHFVPPDDLHDRITGYNHSVFYIGHDMIYREEVHNLQQCNNGIDMTGQRGPNGDGFCDYRHHLCHRITSSHMRLLHNWNQVQQPYNYYYNDDNDDDDHPFHTVE